MKKIVMFTVLIICLAGYFHDSLMHNLSRAYQKAFAVMHYEYTALFDHSCKKELSWKRKIFCKNEYATDEVMEFLRTIEE